VFEVLLFVRIFALSVVELPIYMLALLSPICSCPTVSDPAVMLSIFRILKDVLNPAFVLYAYVGRKIYGRNDCTFVVVLIVYSTYFLV